LYGSATSMPTVNPSLAQSMLSNMTINPSTNPTLYSAYKNLNSQVYNTLPNYT
jgi:formylmethanofuran dehydrogenase subunit D